MGFGVGDLAADPAGWQGAGRRRQYRAEAKHGGDRDGADDVVRHMSTFLVLEEIPAKWPAEVRRRYTETGAAQRTEPSSA
jgi:hypothetical protein